MNKKYFLIQKNRYRDSSILDSSDEWKSLVEKAKNFVHKDNMDNGFGVEEKLKNWKSYFIEFFDEDGSPMENVFYSGKNPFGKDFLVYSSDTGDSDVLISETGVTMKAFIGYDPDFDAKKVQFVGKKREEFPFYFKNLKEENLKNLNSQSLSDKIYYYIIVQKIK